MSADSKNPVEKLFISLQEYLALRTDEAKLKSVEGLSVFFGRVIVMAIFFVLMAVFLLFAGFALSYLAGRLLNSDALGFAVVGGVFLVAAVVVYMLRKKLFVDSMVSFFISVFFKDR